MADNVKALFPKIPTQEIDQYKVTVWTYDIHVTQSCIRKICWEYHVNTPWKTIYPNERGGADFMHQWCIRHNDNKGYEGRMHKGWDRIFAVRGRFYLTELEAKQAAIERLLELMNKQLERVEEYGKGIKNLMKV